MQSWISDLEQKFGLALPAISAAGEKTNDVMARLSDSVRDLEDANSSIVVTGSLGRGEASDDSDADWLLLVDGPSNPDHAVLAREIEHRVKGVVPKEPGDTRTFGEIVISHDLVHYIAGTQDTNKNLTRRILLLAESRALSNAAVRKRVIGNVLARYVLHDRSVARKDGKHQPVPHFLLNDVVRYWRTMASDFASKMWEKQRKGWGIRNVKLRFSRKLLFIWGLLASFSGELFATETMEAAMGEEEYLLLLSNLIAQQADVTPLELLARVVMEADDRQVASDIFSSYDHFLEVLSNSEARRKLEEVQFESAVSDPTYDDLRIVSNSFRRGVTSLFFDRHLKLKKLIRDFGVF